MSKSIQRILFSLSCIGLISSDAAAAGGQQNPMGSLFPLLVIFGIFYFLLIRPQQKKAKEHQQLLNSLKKDDKVITNGGLHGVVTTVKNDIVELKIAEGVKVNVSKTAIANVITQPMESQTVTPEVVK